MLSGDHPLKGIYKQGGKGSYRNACVWIQGGRELSLMCIPG